MEKRKRKELSLKEKVELINQSAGRSQRQLADQFGIGKTQVQTILKRKAEIMEGYEANAGTERKRLCIRSPVDQVNSFMWDWFQKARSNGIQISGPMLREKALHFARELGVSEDDFKASNGWLNRFRQRHNISFLSVCGESASVSQETVNDWITRLPDILSGYSAHDIFNMDETGLFFRALPDRSLSISGEECKGGKRSKDRLTVSLCVNMEGQFEKPLVIGKAAVPRCFRNINVKNLPVIWRHNKKAWMTGAIFTEWIKDFNLKMKKAGRNVILLLDNAPSHPANLTLSNVKLVFLPANTTSKLQPLDQGIIQNMKQFYRKRLLRSVISKIDDDSVASAESVSKSVSVLDAVQWINSAVKDVKTDTVKKCFRKAGLSEIVLNVLDEEEADDDNVPIMELVELMRAANNKISVSDSMTPEEFINVDTDLQAGEDLDENWENELLELRKGSDSAQTENDEDVDEELQEAPEPTCEIKSHQEALKWIEQLKLYCFKKDLVSVLPAFSRAQEDFEKLSVSAMCSLKQSTIDTFFKQ